MKNDNEVIPTFSKFGANVFKLITGNVAAQLITIGAMPIFTRMYTPDDFGIYQLFVSITSVLIVVAALQYDMAIMLPPAEEDAVNVTALSVIVVTIFSLLTLPIIGCFRVSIAYFFEAKEMAPYLWLAPLAIFTGAI
ncbi:MAG: oligosaccharide flippase family protein, partial [Dethiobacteria bacterium]